MSKTLSNILYNGIYQLLVIAIPIITVPYVARVLGAESLGISAYVASIGMFLGIIITMGVSQLGARIIAQSNSQDILINFSKLWVIQFCSGFFVLLIYAIAVFFFLSQKYYFVLEAPLLIGCMLDISWFYIGIGEVKKVVLRNTVVQLASLLVIFMFVHSSADLWIYILVNSVRLVLANSVFWITLFKKWHFSVNHFIRDADFRYFREAMVLLAPQIAVQLYTNFDSTLVGIIAGAVQLSYYDQSQKTARIVVAVITSVSTVLMPKMAQIEKNKDNERLENIFKLSLDYTLMISLYFSLLLMVNTRQFVPWFFGRQFLPMTDNMYLVSLIVVFISYGGVIANQFTLAKGMYRSYAIPYYFGAIFSITLNIILVNMWGANGGTITIVVTEFVVCLVRILIVKKQVNFRNLVKGQYKYILSFIIILIIGNNIPYIFKTTFFNLIFVSFVVTISYFGLLVLFKTRFVDDFKKVREHNFFV